MVSYSEAPWREVFSRRWGVVTLAESVLTEYRDQLWTTRCCRVKGSHGGRPHEMYRSSHVQRFLSFANAAGVEHAIISDRYGLHFPDQCLPSYDLGPWDLSPEGRRALGRMITTQAETRGHRAIVVYNNSPLMSRPYLEILSHSGLAIFFTTRLPAAGALS